MSIQQKFIPCLIFLFLFTNISFAQTKMRIFVKDLKPGQGVTKETAIKIRDIITLTIFEKYGDKYRIVSDDDVAIMYKQAEAQLAIGCDSEKCLIEISYSIDADEIIYGTVSSEMGKIELTMNNLKRNKDTDEFLKKSFVKKKFYNSQLDWYTAEITKKLINPGYWIDESKAPTEIKIELDIVELKLPELKGLDISVFKFKTTDSTIARIIDYLKELIKNGDDYFNEKNYSYSLSEYQKVIEKIETKLTKSKQIKLEKFKASVEDRIVASYAMYFKEKIEIIDKIAKSGEYENALYNYMQIKNEFNKINLEYKNKLEYLNSSINERVDSIYIIKAKFNEKEGDTYYSEYKFEKAIEKYGDALLYIDKLYYNESEENNRYKATLIEKQEVANQTGYSYVKNTVQSYCDWIEYYNISEQKSEAKKTLEKLRAYIKGSRWCDDENIIKMFNERAELLKEERIYGIEELKINDLKYRLQEAEDGISRMRIWKTVNWTLCILTGGVSIYGLLESNSLYTNASSKYEDYKKSTTTDDARRLHEEIEDNLKKGDTMRLAMYISGGVSLFFGILATYENDVQNYYIEETKKIKSQLEALTDFNITPKRASLALLKYRF